MIEAKPIYAFMQHRRVLDFIKRRWSKNPHDWITGNCYWFAYILYGEFRDMRIFYLPIEGHFVGGMYGRYYDALGEYKCKETPVPIIDILACDPLWWRRLERDCKD
jgi:hypothetical protein